MKKGTQVLTDRKKQTTEVITPPKTATQMLYEHHGVLRGIMERLSRTSRDDIEQRRALTDELYSEVQMHERIEEHIFYPAISDFHPKLDAAWSEHRQMTDQLAALLRADPGGARFEEELRLMRDVLEAHAHLDEELEMFPEVERLMDEAWLVEMGERLQDRLDRLRSSRTLRARHRLERMMLRGPGRLIARTMRRGS
ncbi:hemerythrin domain-containing protein [Sphaerimonospora thailandensis]|uniref:Hemerythrin-like domain-containing protein n=1 Tax=Sphaerimonospora thailandensis TaxID=795644 RepID=A0A8J3W2C3_9ACTN|nr:hemerythrin domain-containing protein [Sphaerimonospora thailandensis]GIH72646.1 hypothetical protein Mth01_48990 [Sphaerimonospora thailandensis]